MKKLSFMLVCLFAMMASGTGLSAQEVTVVLQPGWNWIGYPYSESADLETAFGDFEPMPGDVIASFGGLSDYIEGIGWLGEVDEMKPGWGYMYYSSRTAVVSVVLHAPTSSSIVTTAEPTDITGTSAVVGGTVTLGEGNHVFARGVCWSTEPNPDIDGNHVTEATVTGSLSDTLTELTSNTTYYVRAYVVTDYGLAYGEELSFTTLVEYQYVDLGLPSGLMWATCNVGAETPEGYGDHFAWGETEPKDNYSWFSYQYCYGNEYTLTKYCNESSFGYNNFADDLTILLPEDDAATANWGTDWRMPIKEEWQELFDNTTRTWTNQNGVNGWLFTGSNGNTLFLPAAGYRIENGFYSAGSTGYYWSSSLNVDEPYYAWRLYFNSGNYQMYQYGDRCFGQSVRPVHTLQYSVTAIPNPAEGGIVIGGGSYEVNTVCTLTAIPNDGYYFYGWSEGEGGESFGEATYTFTVTGDVTLVANFAYCGCHEYVDLGLPCGTLWARNNVGANAITDHGDYFAWGETQPKDYYSWYNYQYCNGGSHALTKYCNNASFGYQGFTDNLTVLQPEDDAATVNWGSDWRMPTGEEFQELFDNTTVTDLTLNGVEGCLFTASNGNSLFFPYEGLACWSSSLGVFDPSYAYFFEPFAYSYTDDGNRYFGQPVRAVRSESQNIPFIIDATANPAEGGEISGAGTYQVGVECTLTATPNEGYTFANWTENGEIVSVDATYTFTVDADRTLVANFNINIPTGAINGKFTINANGAQVYFSQGNLQYQASTNTWKFADNQYDYVGSDNSNISSTYDGWIDLFGWGTSGWNSGNVYYFPWNWPNSDGSLYGPPGSYNLVGSYAHADWGVHNAINNGGNQTNQWRTLTQSEWDYVFSTRSTASGIRYAKANVNNVNGVILLPDDWSTSTYIMNNTNDRFVSFSCNTLTALQWSTLEQAGAVFLPAAGYRNGTSISSIDSSGGYWSATNYSSYNSYDAYRVYFNDSNIYTYGSNGYDGRGYGHSVRLVRALE